MSHKFIIILSHNMKKQKIEGTHEIFDTFDKAYEYGIGKYGSGTYRIYFEGILTGWEIREI